MRLAAGTSLAGTAWRRGKDPTHIRVNSVHPGFIWTPLVEYFVNTAADPASVRAALDAKHPLAHVGDADDVAWGLKYLASDEAKFVTGSELVIDGGQILQIG